MFTGKYINILYMKNIYIEYGNSYIIMCINSYLYTIILLYKWH
jgi:hypothetical protein